MRNLKLVFLVNSLILFLGCNQQSSYYELPEDYLPNYEIYVGMKGYSNLPKDDNGNYIIKLNSKKIYTSTKYEEIANTRSLYSINGITEYMTVEDLEKKLKIKVIENIVGKDYTTSDNYMIPDHFEIIVEKKY